MTDPITSERSRGAAVLLPSSKVLSGHLERLALVYVRQSSQKQVEHNIESTQLQYQLADRAEAYGWPKPRIEIIDEDLGVSGRSIEGRGGFQRLLSEVSLGHVGIVMGMAFMVKRGRSDYFPFGPSLAIGTVVVILAANPILRFYGFV